MKTRNLLPLICLTLVFIACGKQEKTDATATSGGQVVTTVTQTTVATSTTTTTNTNTSTDLQNFCQTYGGQVTSGICKLSRYYQNNAWLSLSWGDINTGIQIYTGQKVTVNVSGNPRVLVGGYNYGSGSLSFLSQNYGLLAFQAYSSTYSVQRIQVDTCYNAPNASVACP